MKIVSCFRKLHFTILTRSCYNVTNKIFAATIWITVAAWKNNFGNSITYSQNLNKSKWLFNKLASALAQTLLCFSVFCKDIDDTQHGKLDAKTNFDHLLRWPSGIKFLILCIEWGSKMFQMLPSKCVHHSS